MFIKSSAYSVAFLLSTLMTLGYFSTVKAATSFEPCIFETCKCSLDSKNKSISVDCEYDDQSQATPNYFPKRLVTSPELPISDFVIAYYDFAQIPDNAFDGLSIDWLVIIKCNLRSLTKNALKGLTKLERFYLAEESNFESIESGAFDSATNTLNHLEMTSLQIDDSKFNVFMSEIRKLKKINSLNFDSNQITEIGAGHFKDLADLKSLSLNDNQITKIDANAFITNPLINNFQASGNKLNDLNAIFEALKQSNQLSSLFLSRNQIKSLKVDAPLEYLNYLYLANNEIEAFDNQSLVGTNAIYNLDLTSNKINFVDDSRIQQLYACSTLKLGNNYLSKVPAIFKSRILSTLDISLQNGQLKSIQDYAFERDNVPYDLMKLYLSGNDIETFGQKAFCSRYFVPTYISTLSFSYKTMKAMPKCVLKQLSLKTTQKVTRIQIANSTEALADYSDVCNCDLLSFSLLHGLNFTGACQSVFSTLNCDHAAYKDPCINQTQYECVASLTTTTTTTTTTTRRPTTTSASQRIVSSSSNLYLAGLAFLFLFLF